MRFDDFIDGVIDRLRALLQSENRTIRFTSRLIALGVAASIITIIVPSLASELSSPPQIIESPIGPNPAPVDSETAQQLQAPESSSVSSSPSPDIQRPPISPSNPSPLAESTESATATELPPQPLTVQPVYTMRIPSTLKIDPRAKSDFFPQLFAATGVDTQTTMACISSPSNLIFDIGDKQSSQKGPSGQALVLGDRTGQVLISGTTARVINIINSGMGLLATAPAGGIANKSVLFQFVAVTKPVTDPGLCARARSVASTEFRALDLTESTVKGHGTLK